MLSISPTLQITRYLGIRTAVATNIRASWFISIISCLPLNFNFARANAANVVNRSDNPTVSPVTSKLLNT